MIQLRWHKQGPRHPEQLQYRVMTNVEEIGLQDPIWSDWVPVPVVVDPSYESWVKITGPTDAQRRQMQKQVQS